MSQFIGWAQGGCGVASRQGSKQSGMDVGASGWNTGAQIVMTHRDGKDHVQVYRTSGTSGVGHRKLVAEWVEEEV